MPNPMDSSKTNIIRAKIIVVKCKKMPNVIIEVNSVNTSENSLSFKTFPPKVYKMASTAIIKPARLAETEAILSQMLPNAFFAVSQPSWLISKHNAMDNTREMIKQIAISLQGKLLKSIFKISASPFFSAFLFITIIEIPRRLP